MVSIKPALPVGWTPDDEVENCARCDLSFSVLNRKHHCRSCGKIFCASCSAHNGSIPSYVARVVNTSGKGLRLCSGCNTSIDQKKKTKDLIFIFSCLPLYIKELEVLLFINKKWNTATTCVISCFKSLQYKTGYHTWTGIERRLVKTHWKQFAGHSRLMVQTLKGIVNTDMSKITRHFKFNKERMPCDQLYCDKCSKFLGPFDLLELLYSQCTPQLLKCPELESWIGISITKMNKHWLLLFIPWLLQIGKSNAAQRIIANYILPVAMDNIELTYAIFFECELLITSELKSYYMAIQSRLMSGLTMEIKEGIRKTQRFINMMAIPNKLSDFDIAGTRLPYDPQTTVQRILHTGVRQLTSSTKPWVIPLQTSRGKIHILQKNDDLRKDRLVIITMKLMRLMESRLTFHDYHVFPITPIKGWVEMIPQSETIYDINKKTTIQNYIISQNRDKPAAVLRDYFMYSCASNCVLAFILGLGDRNLHNILICPKSSSLAHIDFSYIMGYDPKHIESTEMKITSGMVDMLGGYDSQEFKHLKAFCSTTFTNIRKYTHFWYSLFRYLAVSLPPIYPHHGDLKAIQTHIDKRLMPDFTEEQVKVAIVNSVNSNSDSWKSSISDITHSVRTSIQGLLFNIEI